MRTCFILLGGTGSYIFLGIKMANLYQQVLEPLVSYLQDFTVPLCPRLSYYHHQGYVFFLQQIWPGYEKVLYKL